MILAILLLILCIITVSIVLYMIWLAHHDTLTKETILSERLPRNFHDFTIFFIADIHRRKVNKQTIQRVQQTVDAVFIGGDLIERGVSFDKMINNIRTLKILQAPIYFVWGNNDYEKQHDLIFLMLNYWIVST